MRGINKDVKIILFGSREHTRKSNRNLLGTIVNILFGLAVNMVEQSSCRCDKLGH